MQQLAAKIFCEAIGGFTACTSALSLLETTVAKEPFAAGGGRVLLSPVGPGFDRSQNHQQQRGGTICLRVKSISWGGFSGGPKIHGESGAGSIWCKNRNRANNLSPRGFLRENHGANEPIKSTSQKGRR
jgi:hypothetical protein